MTSGWQGPSMRLSRGQRKALLVTHIVSSVGWLGISLTLLTLAITGRFSDVVATRTSAYWAMHLLGDVLVVPISLISLLSGVLLGLGTAWGVFRHRWVTTKLTVTTATFALSIFALRAQISDAYVSSGPHLESSALAHAGTNLVIAGCVSVSLYTFTAVLSVFKPWGLTVWARRREAARRSPARP